MTAAARLSNDDARTCAAATAAGIDRRRRIREYVERHPGCTLLDLLRDLGLKRHQARMCDVRRIRSVTTGGTVRYYPEGAAP